MDEHWRPLVRYVTGLTHSADLGEDLAQEAFIALWRQRSSWEIASSVRPLLYGIARNLALKERRRRSVRRKWRSCLKSDRPRVSTPYERLVREELREAFERALDTLPPRRREAFVLARYHDLPPGEIAEVMGISYQTAANHVSMAMADLRRLLEKHIE